MAKSQSVAFRKHDAGKGFRPHDAPRQDCQVRALATATGLSYNGAWTLLYQMQGELRHCGLPLVHGLRAEDPRLGVKRALAFPAAKGRSRMTGAEFCRQYPRGNFILRLAGHVVAVEDGVLIDTLDCSSKCVYAAWEVRRLQ